jgi:L-alanine-DL-glutamate epimerase-like enolase superfamily enzyme
VRHGFRAIKMKVGRGYKWMDAEAGFQRDVEAVRAAREAVGPDVQLMLDGNNGFDLDGALRLFEQIGEHDIYWAEEMFPESEADCARFREFLSARGFATLIADGETQRAIEPMLPIHAAGLIDVQQLDINVLGLTGWSHLCRDVLPRYPARGTPTGRPLASPHTWPSQFGVYVSAHLAAAFENVLSVEVPPYTHAAIVPRGIEWRGGQYHLRGEPGLGLAVDEREWNETLRAKEIVYA